MQSENWIPIQEFLRQILERMGKQQVITSTTRAHAQEAA